MPEFTENQRRAVTERGNVIVSAGAGSGKTTVMIARIIDKLKRGASLADMLIVTFTRASAADMRVKLSEELVRLKRSGEFDGAAEALDCMSVCNIGTLHSYCQKLVKNYFYVANIDPSATVCEESEARAVKRAAVRAAVNAAMQADGDDKKYFDAMYGMLCNRRSSDGIEDAVSDIVDFALSMPDPSAFVTYIKPDREYFDALDGIFAKRRTELTLRIDALKTDLAAAGMTKHVAAAEELIDYIDGRIDAVTRTSHRASGDMRDVLNEEFKSLKSDCKDHRTDYAEAQTAKLLDGAPYVKALASVAADAMQRYAKSKERLGKIDYSDLEHGAFRVLSDAECMAEIARSVKYVFIDEFQDVNPLQSEIAARFKAVGAEMFVVGDVKQSIYGFRRCSPEHFKRAMSDPDYTHISLSDNFRSSEAVIDFINTVFDGVMTDGFGGVDYGADGEKLRWGNKKNVGGRADFVLVDEKASKDADGAAAEDGADGILSDRVYSVIESADGAAAEDAEARFVADSVVDWLATAEKPSLGSVAVLLRSVRGEFCTALAREFEARGIKYSIGRKTSVKDFPEAVALMDILRCADNRFDDVALYTALRSPMGGFSDEQLLEIATEGEAAARRNGVAPAVGSDRKAYAFWQKVHEYDGRLSARLDGFFALRGEIARYAKSHDCADTLGYITSRIDYFQYVYETGGNAQAVETLIDIAADRHCDANAFLNYYDSSAFDLPVDVGGDAVTVTTIHSSKGLEYDHVIVADTAHGFNERENYGRVLVSENGIAVKIPDADKKELVKTAPWIVENALAPDRLKQEELRLFYVALTRAKKRLTVCGKNKDVKTVEPRAARRALDFMRNVTPHAPDAPLRPIDAAESSQAMPVVPAITEAVRARCEFKYETDGLPIKTCVTALAHSASMGDENTDYTAAAPVLTADDTDRDGDKGATEDGADARARGTAYHRAMELIDFNAPDLKSVEARCENYALIDGNVVLRAASAMRRLTENATFVAKERYFIADMPASELYGADARGSVLVQGVIDLLIVDADGVATIVDYKTGDPRRLANDGYRTQLKLYSAAVERTTPYKVGAALLYSFESGELIKP